MDEKRELVHRYHVAPEQRQRRFALRGFEIQLMLFFACIFRRTGEFAVILTFFTFFFYRDILEEAELQQAEIERLEKGGGYGEPTLKVSVSHG